MEDNSLQQIEKVLSSHTYRNLKALAVGIFTLVSTVGYLVYELDQLKGNLKELFIDQEMLQARVYMLEDVMDEHLLLPYHASVVDLVRDMAIYERLTLQLSVLELDLAQVVEESEGPGRTPEENRIRQSLRLIENQLSSLCTRRGGDLICH